MCVGVGVGGCGQCGGVIMDSTHYNNKIMDLLNDEQTNEHISLQTINKNVDIFDKSYKSSSLKKKYSGLSLLIVTPTITRFYGLPKTHEPRIHQRPITLGVGSVYPLLKKIAKTFSQNVIPSFRLD